MNEKYQSKLDLFVANTQKIKNSFIWQSTMPKRLAALLYAVEDKDIDCDAIRESHEFIKRNTGLFSAFRGNSAISIATLLSLSEDRESRFSDTLTVYDMMKNEGFRASDYLVVAAYQIAAHAQKDKFAKVVERAKEFYDGMKEEHRFLTGRDDYIFAAMLGLSDVELETGLVRMEQFYIALKPKFFSGNGLQALAQVLVLGGETEKAVPRVLALSEAFRRQRIRLDKENTLSSLGVLSLLPADIDTIACDVIGVYEFLRTQKGFGSWTITKQELLLFSSAIVAFKNVDDAKNGLLTTAISTSLTNIIIAQQTAIAAAAASSAAAAASSSSN